jgi:hypothetical protein
MVLVARGCLRKYTGLFMLLDEIIKVKGHFGNISGKFTFCKENGHIPYLYQRCSYTHKNKRGFSHQALTQDEENVPHQQVVLHIPSP